MTPNLAHHLRLLVVPLLAMLLVAGSTPTPAPSSAPHPLIWDTMEKRVEARPEEGEATFEFHVTNRSDETVQILHINPSCGCTVAEMPSTPWILEAGASGSFSAVVDHRGKEGTFSKTLAVHSSKGVQHLTMVIALPDTEEARRVRNQQLASTDRQAIFRGDCASCHVAPAVGKTGAELFQAACAICHEAPNRARMVPDLFVAGTPRDEAYWRKWIAEGKEGTLMPGFGSEQGGPLTAEQIASLVEYTMSRLPTPTAND